MANSLTILRLFVFWTIVVFIKYSVVSLPDYLLWYNLKSDSENEPIWHFKNLHESGCCSDRVECREMDENKTNYADRIFRSVDASAAFLDPTDNASFVHALLFRQNIAAHKNISDKTLHPELVGLSSTKEMTRQPFEPQDPRLFEPLLMYSPAAKDCKDDNVRAWMHYNNNHIFVCGNEHRNKVIIRKTMNWLKGRSKIIDNLENCLALSKVEGNPGHPAMCEKNLIDLLAIPHENGDTTVVAYTEEEGGMDVKGKRMIRIQVWHNKRKVEGSKKYEGRLASIYWYRLDPEKARGVYFTTDAFVCKFEYETGNGSLNAERFIFENGRKHCRPMAVYLECPQGWCNEIGMTTSFTIEGKDGYFYVYFTKSLYHWRIKTRRIPMSVPKVKDALYYGTAGNIISQGEKYKIASPDAPYPPVMIFDATAAFRIQFMDINYTFSYHPLNKWTAVPDKNHYEKSKGTLVQEEDEIKLELFDDISPEAAHFDRKEMKLYLFQSCYYTVYEVALGAKEIADKNSWKKVDGPYSVAQLGFGEGDEIQEVIALGKNLNFILNATHFYYSVGDIRTSNKELRFSFTQLFRIESECFFNDLREYKKALAVYGITVPEQTWFSKQHLEKPLISNVTESNKWETNAIILIIIIGVAVALIGCVAIFTYGNYKEQTHTKRVEHYNMPFLTTKKEQRRKTLARTRNKL